MERKVLVYLSLPITGYDEMERRSFAGRTSGILMAKFEGWEVVNPLSIADRLRKERLVEGSFEEPSYDEYMKADIAALAKCEKAVFCKGWERSEGCKEEYAECLRRGIEICFWDDEDGSLFWQSRINRLQDCSHLAEEQIERI